MTTRVLYIQVLLEKNEHMSTPVWVTPWELPVFAAVHRKSGLTELGKRVFRKPVAPIAATEYDRLEQRYKGPEGSDMSYVSNVYGHGTVGIAKLHEAMVQAAKDTEAFIAAEAANPTPPVAVKAVEFESPFGPVENIPDEALGIETQADLRAFAEGGAQPTVEAVAT